MALRSIDLMLGDWVLYMGKPHYVIAIESDGMVKITTPEKADELRRAIWPDRLEPIPLTREILEKNGFSKSRLMGEQRHFTYYLAPSVSLLAIYDADFSLKIGDCARYIKYVHQLQHSLRLCGIEKEIEL